MKTSSAIRRQCERVLGTSIQEAHWSREADVVVCTTQLRSVVAVNVVLNKKVAITDAVLASPSGYPRSDSTPSKKPRRKKRRLFE